MGNPLSGHRGGADHSAGKSVASGQTLSATFSVENRRSSVDLFSGTTFNIDLNVLRLQF
jgi:hypothetical protein